MKKQRKLLSLDRQTIRQLDATALRGPGGGMPIYTWYMEVYEEPYDYYDSDDRVTKQSYRTNLGQSSAC